MVVTLDKFDLNAVREYLFELMQHINEKSKGDIKMTCIVASQKEKEINHIMPKGEVSDTAQLLITALDELTKKFPEMGLMIERIKL